ncbi:hypothetical protein [Methanosarcina sp.]|uniref:hypothetical protein n=1 Tax=Methanosarcina sp. TaxID=2213 RepID=UPI002BD18671|nr:hypothetical protein [Methanosarcina sp.]HOW13517.1 hypothetical protein [Methanosarcina sp.]
MFEYMLAGCPGYDKDEYNIRRATCIAEWNHRRGRVHASKIFKTVKGNYFLYLYREIMPMSLEEVISWAKCRDMTDFVKTLEVS